MMVMAPRKRSRESQPSYLQARISDAERSYLQDLAERLDTSISGAIRIAIGLALDYELRHGEVEPTEDPEVDESIPFDSEFQQLLARRRQGARRKVGRRG